MQTEPRAERLNDMTPRARILVGWVDAKHTANVILALVISACIIITLIDLIIQRHEYFSQAELLSFYGIYGFIAFSFVVLMGWPLGRILRRGENYYGDFEDETFQSVALKKQDNKSKDKA